MKRISKMPTTIIILSLSWIIAFLGLSAGLYLIFNALTTTNLIVGISVLLAGLLIGAVTRILADIGQMTFEMKNFIIKSFLSFSRQQDNAITVINTLNDNIQSNIDKVSKNLNGAFENLEGNIKILEENLSGKLQSINAGLEGINGNLSSHLNTLNDNIQSNISNLNELLTNSLKDINTQLKSMYDEVYSLKDAYVQVNCDSRDINQNIYAIRDFFEKIEKHLNLKK